MKDNTQNTKQCDSEVDLTSPGIMTLTSQLGLAPIPHTLFLKFPQQERIELLAHVPIKIMRYKNNLWTH